MIEYRPGGADLGSAMRQARLRLTDVARLLEVSRPTVYAWLEGSELPDKGAALVARIHAALSAGVLPLSSRISPDERPRIIRRAVYGE